MRGCYTLALPELSASRIDSALAQGRSAAGSLIRFAGWSDAEIARQRRQYWEREGVTPSHLPFKF